MGTGHGAFVVSHPLMSIVLIYHKAQKGQRLLGTRTRISWAGTWTNVAYLEQSILQGMPSCWHLGSCGLSAFQDHMAVHPPKHWL